jgi:hypothetical protein
MYPAFVWSVVLLAIMDISARDSLNDRPRPGQLGDQCSHTPETGSPQQAIAQRFSGVLGMFSSLEVKVLYPT